MERFLIIGALPRSLTNFRGELIRSIAKNGIEITAMAGSGDTSTENDLSSDGIQFREFKIQRNGLNPLADLAAYREIRQAFREVKPDIALAYTIKPVIWGGLASRRLGTCRFFALITGLGFAFRRGGVFKNAIHLLIVMLYRLALAKAEGVIFQNVDDRDTFVRKRIVPVEKCHVVCGSGVNTTLFPATPIPSGTPRFLLVARLLVDKGIREFCSAAKIVKRRFPDTEFEIVGPREMTRNGIPGQEIQSWLDEGTILYSGSTTDVRPFISSCHVFVLPSYYLEGLPRTLLEALSIGRPIITTNTPGCRETVEEGVNGFLVPTRSASALAERMFWFLENRGRWESMGEASRKFAEERFDVRRVNQQMLEIMGIDQTTQS